MKKLYSGVLALVLGGSALLPLTASAWYGDTYYDDYAYYYYPAYEVPAYGYYYEPYSPYPASYYYPVDYSYYSYAPQYTNYSGSYGYSSPSPANYSYPVGDTDTFGYDLCYWEGYGRGRCDFNPRQPVYDHWTGTWY